MSLTSCDEIVVVHDMLQDVVYSVIRYFRGAGVDLNALCAPDICLCPWCCGHLLFVRIENPL
jgi:hypothetical protein